MWVRIPPTLLERPGWRPDVQMFHRCVGISIVYPIKYIITMSMYTIIRQINACHVHCSSCVPGAATTQSWRRNRKIVPRAAADIFSNSKSLELQKRGQRENNATHDASFGAGKLDARMREHRLHVQNSENEDPLEDETSVSAKEKSRREKISRANKGKVPWNKGKNMSEEVKAKISQKTYEAMQRPDVRARMKKANANRAPHSEEVRKRIRDVLRKRADEARKEISLQSDHILSAMKASDDPRERDIAMNTKNADEIIGKLAWRLLHRDFDLMYDKWENNTDGFRDAVVLRFDELGRRKNTRRKKASPKAIQKEKKASTQARQKIIQAEEKLQSVEAALGKLKTLKTTYKNDPESLSIVEQKEVQTTALLQKLREQVELLYKAMQISETTAAAPAVQGENSNVSVLDSKWERESALSTQLPWGKK